MCMFPVYSPVFQHSHLVQSFQSGDGDFHHPWGHRKTTSDCSWNILSSVTCYLSGHTAEPLHWQMVSSWNVGMRHYSSISWQVTVALLPQIQHLTNRSRTCPHSLISPGHCFTFDNSALGLLPKPVFLSCWGSLSSEEQFIFLPGLPLGDKQYLPWRPWTFRISAFRHITVLITLFFILDFLLLLIGRFKYSKQLHNTLSSALNTGLMTR